MQKSNKVWIIDDDRSIRWVLEKALARENLATRSFTNARDAMLALVASGQAALVVGTHAVIQDQVQFKNLALAIIDEQHRFGVAQRLALRQKLAAHGMEPHMLMMSATPIPRTLVLAAFGDMDVSKLTEKPAGRKPIQTVTIPTERIGDIVERLRAALKDEPPTA